MGARDGRYESEGRDVHRRSRIVAWKYSVCLPSREAIFKESRSVIEFDGSKVNYCHLTLLYGVNAIQAFVKGFLKQQVLSDGLPPMYQ